MNQVREHLRLLSIFHYVIGGFLFLFSLFPAIYLAMGLMVVLMPEPSTPEISVSDSPTSEHAAEPDSESGGKNAESLVAAEEKRLKAMEEAEAAQAMFGGVFITIGAIGILILWVFAILVILAGRRLASHRSHTFCLIIAGLECLFMPFGTILGVFTLIVLMKPEARVIFGLPNLDDPDPTNATA
ncbi:MAG: hypothetical protein KDN19_00965 [Verrucomicrobiae bacterium]|nr:hypothetical protein [Verrucomicrobiae bacterium]